MEVAAVAQLHLAWVVEAVVLIPASEEVAAVLIPASEEVAAAVYQVRTLEVMAGEEEEHNQTSQATEAEGECFLSQVVVEVAAGAHQPHIVQIGVMVAVEEVQALNF